MGTVERAEDDASRVARSSLDSRLRARQQGRIGGDETAGGASCGDTDRRHLRCPARPERGEQSPASGAAPTADAGRGQSALLEPEGRRHRKRERQHLALSPHVLAELGAARALAQVPAERSPAQLAGGRGRECLADLSAGDLSRAAILDQGGASLKDECLHLFGLAIEHLGDVSVIERPELREDQRGLLLLREVLEVGEELAELGTLLDLLGEADRRALALDLAHCQLPPGPQHAEAAIAGDRVEPGLELE